MARWNVPVEARSRRRDALRAVSNVLSARPVAISAVSDYAIVLVAAVSAGGPLLGQLIQSRNAAANAEREHEMAAEKDRQHRDDTRRSLASDRYRRLLDVAYEWELFLQTGTRKFTRAKRVAAADRFRELLTSSRLFDDPEVATATGRIEEIYRRTVESVSRADSDGWDGSPPLAEEFQARVSELVTAIRAESNLDPLS